MSVATEFAPSVPIPPPARSARHLRAVPLAAPEPAPSAEVMPLASVSVLRAPRPSTSAAPVRLTRLGVIVVALALAVLGGLLVWAAAASSPEASATPASTPRAVTVRAGDTLWSIAGRVAPQRDSRAEVAVLQRLNHLRGVELVPGQQLQVR